MTVTTHSRGHFIYWDKLTRKWYYQDDNSIYDDSRSCKKCLEFPTKEGHDACIANLENVKNACCGHGLKDGYIQK